ncbi:hypothetical protein predicted by Glimmer/Critica [Acetobacter ghanensis]|uniref:UPF0391 membrane protein AGA_812 n=1 Tax=Acetobacter ghanensis TaxID=431306 RepID=A0A0U5F101_9PROT|nr:hypothetical protein predicted by Glimmer/Critica [Acetobacter ghanensis]
MALIRWIIVFLIFALLASLFGFSGAASGFSEIAKVLLFVLLFCLLSACFLVAVHAPGHKTKMVRTVCLCEPF